MSITNRPTTKVTAGALAGALTAIATWATAEFGKVVIPAEIGIAISTVITFAVQWVIPDAPAETEAAEAPETQPIDRP